MATFKQQKAVDILAENGRKSVSAAMREAGYSISSSTKPKKLTDSKAWPILLEKKMPDKKLLKRHNELLDKKEAIAIGKPGEREVLMTDQPDSSAVARALDMAYKLKNKYPAEKPPGDTNVAVINIIRYGEEKKVSVEAEIVP